MEKYTLYENDFHLYEDLEEKIKYLNGIKTNTLKFKIVDLFSYMNNQRMTVLDISNHLEDEDIDKISEEVKKLNENGTLIHFNSTNNRTKTIIEALNSSEYKVDKKVLEVHKQFIKSAKDIEKIKGSLNGNKIVEFYNLFSKLLDLLESAYRDNSIDLNEFLLEDGISIFQKLFADGSGYYDSINKELENFEDSIRQLNDTISIADDEIFIYTLVDDYSFIITNVLDFITDLNQRVSEYILYIVDLFNKLKNIHKDVDLKDFYRPLVNSDDKLFLTLTKDKALNLVISQFDNLIQQESGRGNVFKSFIPRMKNQIDFLVNIRNDILDLRKSMDSQTYFKNIAKEFSSDSSDDINLEIDKYFSTSFIEHFSIKDEYVKIDKENDSLIYELNHKKKIKYTTKEKANTEYTEEEILEIQEQKRKEKEKIDKRLDMINNLFPNNIFINRILDEEEFEFMKNLYFKSIYSFNKVDNKEESFCVDRESNNIRFKIVLNKSEKNFIIRTNNNKMIFNNTEVEVFKL